MSNDEQLVDFAEVGKKADLTEKCTICVVFHDFSELPHELGDKTVSPPLSCHGYSWEIIVYPGGYREPCDNNKCISLFLRIILPKNESNLQVKYTLRAGSKALTTNYKFENNTIWGWSEFLLRKDVLDKRKYFLDEHGSFCVFADIQVYRNKYHVWKPGKTLHLDMLRLLHSKKGADAVFEIDGTKFSVHSSILSQRAPTLAEFVEGANSSDIPLSGVDPDKFKILLHFIYTDEIPLNIDFQAMLELANRFGCSRLKILAESMIVEKGINSGNAADLLLLAESNSCALLREEAMEFISANLGPVMASNGWKRMEESPEIMSELMRVCFLKKRPASITSGMSVAKLRQKLDDKGLDVDGTRQMLIDRLEQEEKNTE